MKNKNVIRKKLKNGKFTTVELPNKNREQAKKLLAKLWERLQGN